MATTRSFLLVPMTALYRLLPTQVYITSLLASARSVVIIRPVLPIQSFVEQFTIDVISIRRSHFSRATQLKHIYPNYYQLIAPALIIGPTTGTGSLIRQRRMTKDTNYI